MSDVLGTQDVSIWNKEETKAVSVITDGSTERLAVDAVLKNVSGNKATFTTIGSKVLLDVNASSDPTQYHIESDANVSTGTVVTSAADVVLVQVTAAGVIDFAAVTSAVSSGYEIAIFIDGVEKTRFTMEQIGNTLGLTDDSSPMWVQTANKQFRWRPDGRAGFTTSFAIKAKATGANVTLYHGISWRELQ